MLQALMNFLSLCWKPFGVNVVGDNAPNSSDGRDGLLWFRDFGRCSSGDFSMAVVQANQVLEDQSQLESGPLGTFVGVYDGHGGPDTARYVCDHLFRHFKEMSEQNDGVVTEDTIRRAFLQTEEGFTALVSDMWIRRPNIATVGSCCLVGVIYQQTLFVANVGDSRAVLGKKIRYTKDVAAVQLSVEHNANLDAVRSELKDLHPNDPQIVVLRHGVWRVKGIIQDSYPSIPFHCFEGKQPLFIFVSRSIGDVYMKHARYNREPIQPKFRLSEPINMPIMSANPSIISHHLEPDDSFIIFASDGLWEHLTNQKAVEIVNNNPRAGSAKRLVKAALQEAARKREMRYSDLHKIDKQVRRHFHDDITVIILFLNHDLISKGTTHGPPLSVRCLLDH
ncbi:hypothetical protein V2J09_011398 [Rumex salicifolius]